MATVIVEPDSASAWIGLVGVAVGALLSTGATWLQRRSGQRENRRLETIAAADELRAGASAVILVTDAYWRGADAGGDNFAWTKLLLEQIERVHVASAVIGRNCGEAAASAAADTAALASGILQNGPADALTKMTEAIQRFSGAFAAEMRTSQA